MDEPTLAGWAIDWGEYDAFPVPIPDPMKRTLYKSRRDALHALAAELRKERDRMAAAHRQVLHKIAELLNS